MLVAFRGAFVSLLGFLVCSNTHAEASQFQPIYQQDDNTLRHAKAKDVLKYMNLTANPCEDFYEFACGNWAKKHVSKAKELMESATPDNYLTARINHDLQQLLEEPITLEDGSAERKVKEFYSSCLTAERNGQQQQAFFSEFITENGGFPAVPGSNWLPHHSNYDWQKVAAELRYRYGMEILIGLHIDINFAHINENSLYLAEPSSTLIPAELCSVGGTKRVDIRDEIYAKLEADVAEHLRRWLTLKPEEAQKVAADIVYFEFELCSAMRANSNEDSLYTNYPRKTLAVISQEFDNKIDFNQFATQSFGSAMYKPVYLTAERYYNQLVKTTNRYNTTTIANYIMYRALSFLSFPLDDSPSKRPIHCVNVIKLSLPKVLGDMYQRKHTDLQAKSAVELLFGGLRSAFRNSLDSSWIQESIRHMGKQKLSDIKLSFPEYEKMYLNDLEIERTKYWQNLRQLRGLITQQEVKRIYTPDLPEPSDEIEAYDIRLQYRHTHKRIDLPWALLQAPYYHQACPHAMLYGMLGQKLAQALATAFDDNGWTSDFLKVSVWDRLTAQEYHSRMQCFRQQLSNYLFNNPTTFQNNTKLRQLITSSSGLNVAFNAYLSWLSFLSPHNDFNTLIKETLPELNFTNTQLFFIAYAQMHCNAESKPTQPSGPILSPLQQHTLARYDVNGPLLNSVEFAREFGCPVGAEMNPADKCIIY